MERSRAGAHTPGMSDQVQEALAVVVQYLAPVVVALIGLASLKATQWITAHTKNAALQGVLVRLNEAVTASVSDVAQSYADELKAASEDGKLSIAEAAEAKANALAKTRALLGPAGVKELAKVLGLEPGGPVNDYLNAKIEQTVRELPRPLLPIVEREASVH